MSRKTRTRRILGSVLIPLLPFHAYWRAFDGQYTQTDIVWGVAVTAVLALAIYFYLPIGRNVERGSLIWFLGLFATISLLFIGWSIAEVESNPAWEAWKNYMILFALFVPGIHLCAKIQDKPNEITLFKGPVRWQQRQKPVDI